MTFTYTDAPSIPRGEEVVIPETAGSDFTFSMYCMHYAPVEFGAADVHWREDGTGWVHAPCDDCGTYRVWEVSQPE